MALDPTHTSIGGGKLKSTLDMVRIEAAKPEGVDDGYPKTIRSSPCSVQESCTPPNQRGHYIQPPLVDYLCVQFPETEVNVGASLLQSDARSPLCSYAGIPEKEGPLLR